MNVIKYISKKVLASPTFQMEKTLHKPNGLLVLLGYDITAFTPIAYQRGSLPRPLKEISSCGGFRAYMLSALIPSRRSYSAMPLA
ncbi:hypothetical protein MNBD_BACTEROID05-581 [hydrothermal vent metagenome]|uniref:Uncharacterized protein n=1 Tax=hydrothermal vent metagenome TaxID=652676 RepID=A0A3B0TK63_9ZZZZ